MAVERVCARPRLGVPDFERSVRGSADNDIALHLR